MADRHSAWGEGIDVGLIGGVAVAVFFLVLDLIDGIPFRTPSVLGQAILFGNSEPDLQRAVPEAVAAYTVFHFVLFILLGMLLVRLIHLGTGNPVVRFALLPVFLAFEVFFLGVVNMFSERTAELFPSWTVLTANSLAALAMGFYLWVTHPAFRHSVTRTPLGAADD